MLVRNIYVYFIYNIMFCMNICIFVLIFNSDGIKRFAPTIPICVPKFESIFVPIILYTKMQSEFWKHVMTQIVQIP